MFCWVIADIKMFPVHPNTDFTYSPDPCSLQDLEIERQILSSPDDCSRIRREGSQNMAKHQPFYAILCHSFGTKYFGHLIIGFPNKNDIYMTYVEMILDPWILTIKER